MSKRILVIGATGMLGKAISRQLKEDGFHVRVLSRDFSKAQSLFGQDFEIFEGNVFQKETLESAMDQADGIYISLPEQNIAEAVNNILEEAKKAHIDHIGYTSGCTVRKDNAWHPMIRSHFDAENLITQSGLPYSIFRLTMVLDTLPRYANKGKPFIMGRQPHSWSWIYSADLARMVSKSFLVEKAKNRKFTIFGPDTYSIPEAVDLYNARFHPGAKKAKPTPYWATGILGLFLGAKFRYARSIFKYFEDHPEEGDPAEANDLLGKPQTGLNDFFQILQN